MCDFSKPKFDENNMVIPFKEKYIVYSFINNKVSVVGERIYKILELSNGYNMVSQIAQQMHTSEDEVYEIIKCCEKHIVSDEKKKGCSNNIPRHLDCWFSVTNNCNFDCPYCYIDKNANFFTMERGKEVIGKLINTCVSRNLDELHIRFAGGEPLLYFENIKKCVEYAESTKGKLKAVYSIITNGTLVNDAVCQWAKANNVRINISLDGLNEYHNRTRKYKNGIGSYDDVYRAICLLEKYEMHFTTMITITLNNLENIVELCKELVKHENIKISCSFEKSISGHKAQLVQEQIKLIKVLNECLDLFENEIQMGNLNFQFSIGRLRVSQKRKRACSAGINSIAINCDGIVAMCGMGLSRGRIVNNDEKIYKLIQQKEIYSVTSSERKKCRDCIWKLACCGGCSLDNLYYWNKLNGYSPYCETIKAILPRLVKINGERMYYLFEKGVNDNAN